MKTLIFIILTCLVLTPGVHSQTSDGLDLVLMANDTEQQIRDIDKFRENIKNNISNFRKIEKYKDSLSYREIYVKDNVLLLVKVQQMDNKIEKNVEWYFLNGQLMYSEVKWI